MVRSQIEEALRRALEPVALRVLDQSEAHAGHRGAGNGGHYEALIVSQRFVGLSPLARHRLVHEAIQSITGIHAFSFQARTPEEQSETGQASHSSP